MKGFFEREKRKVKRLRFMNKNKEVREAGECGETQILLSILRTG